MYKIIQSSASYSYKLSKNQPQTTELTKESFLANLSYEDITEAFYCILGGFPGVKLTSVAVGLFDNGCITYNFSHKHVFIEIETDCVKDEIDWERLHNKLGWKTYENEPTIEKTTMCTCTNNQLMWGGCKCGFIIPVKPFLEGM